MNMMPIYLLLITSALERFVTPHWLDYLIRDNTIWLASRYFDGIEQVAKWYKV
jgi:hypothetical protein